MIANNFFSALGDFFTNVIFVPYDKLRFTDGWWSSNIINALLVIIGFIAFIYWMGLMKKHGKEANL